MQRVATTVIALIGPRAADHARAVGEAANVAAVVPPDGEPLDRAGQAWRHATRTSRTYLLHDADPLASVGEAWVGQWDGDGHRGAVDVAVAEVTSRWRARSLELPDYYLVLDAEDLSPTWRHWYLGVVRDAAPVRVVPVADTASAVERALVRLRAGRWWPELPELLERIDQVVPDVGRLAADDEESGTAGSVASRGAVVIG